MMRWTSALLLVACTAGQPSRSIGSSGPDADADFAFIRLVPAIVEAIAPASQTQRPLLVDVQSFMAAGETVTAKPVPRTTVAGVIGRSFRDVLLQDAIIQPSQDEYRIVDNGVHVYLDALHRRGSEYEAIVTRRDTYIDAPGTSSVNFLQVRFTFVYEDGRWIVKKRENLIVS